MSGDDERSKAIRVESGEELQRRLPEINGVRGRIRDQVIDVFVESVPEYFWVARASEAHHPEDERGLCGLWIHTKRVFTAYTMLEPTFRAMSRVDTFEANCARAAVLLHDAFKYGRDCSNDGYDHHPYAEGRLDYLPQYTETSHDVEMAAFVRQETDMPEEVAHAIECHGGSPDWYSHDGPRPDDDLTMLVHLADGLASSSEHRLPLYRPTRELRLVAGTDAPTVSDDWIDNLDNF